MASTAFKEYLANPLLSQCKRVWDKNDIRKAMSVEEIKELDLQELLEIIERFQSDLQITKKLRVTWGKNFIIGWKRIRNTKSVILLESAKKFQKTDGYHRSDRSVAENDSVFDFPKTPPLQLVFPERRVDKNLLPEADNQLGIEKTADSGYSEEIDLEKMCISFEEFVTKNRRGEIPEEELVAREAHGRVQLDHARTVDQRITEEDNGGNGEHFPGTPTKRTGSFARNEDTPSKRRKLLSGPNVNEELVEHFQVPQVPDFEPLPTSENAQEIEHPTLEPSVDQVTEPRDDLLRDDSRDNQRGDLGDKQTDDLRENQRDDLGDNQRDNIGDDLAQPRDSQPRDLQPRDSQPRDTPPRDSQPRDSQPRDSQPRDSQQRDTQSHEILEPGLNIRRSKKRGIDKNTQLSQRRILDFAKRNVSYMRKFDYLELDNAELNRIDDPLFLLDNLGMLFENEKFNAMFDEVVFNTEHFIESRRTSFEGVESRRTSFEGVESRRTSFEVVESRRTSFEGEQPRMNEEPMNVDVEQESNLIPSLVDETTERRETSGRRDTTGRRETIGRMTPHQLTADHTVVDSPRPPSISVDETRQLEDTVLERRPREQNEPDFSIGPMNVNESPHIDELGEHYQYPENNESETSNLSVTEEDILSLIFDLLSSGQNDYIKLEELIPLDKHNKKSATTCFRWVLELQKKKKIVMAQERHNGRIYIRKYPVNR